MSQESVQKYLKESNNPWDYFSGKILDVEEMDFVLKSFLGCKNILDVCGGTGFASHFLTDKASVTVLDMSEKMMNFGKNLYPKVKFIYGSVLDIPFPNETFDGVLIRANLMFFSEKEREKYFAEVHRVLKVNGSLCVMERNKNDFRFLFTPKSISIDPIESRDQFVDLNLIRKLIDKNGFKIIEITGFLFSLLRLRTLFSPRKLNLKQRLSPKNVSLLARIFPNRARWIFVAAKKK